MDSLRSAKEPLFDAEGRKTIILLKIPGLQKDGFAKWTTPWSINDKALL
jgi:hypothetical protein